MITYREMSDIMAEKNQEEREAQIDALSEENAKHMLKEPLI